MGLLLKEQGKLSLAETHYRRALEGFERTLGRNHPNTLTLVGNLGSLLQAQGKLDLAEPYYLRALKGSERTLGRDHPGTKLRKAVGSTIRRRSATLNTIWINDT